VPIFFYADTQADRPAEVHEETNSRFSQFSECTQELNPIV